jgi:hypothetical protein
MEHMWVILLWEPLLKKILNALKRKLNIHKTNASYVAANDRNVGWVEISRMILTLARKCG